MENPNLILTLKAVNERTGKAFALEHNKRRYYAPHDDRMLEFDSREKTPSVHLGDEDIPDIRSQLRLGFDVKPNDIESGCKFGSDPRVCDVILGKREDRISGCHFIITFDAERRLVLRDTSKWGTTVCYDGQGATENRNHFTWILFGGGIKIEVVVQRELRFMVELATHYSCEAEYQDQVDLYLEESRNSLGPIGVLNIQSQDTTTAPTLTLRKSFPYITGTKCSDRVNLEPCTGFSMSARDQYTRPKSSSKEHIVQFVHYTDEIKPWLVMEYLPLGNLEDQHRATSIAVEEILSVLHQGLQALEYLHSRNFAHRDIKPANILFRSRQPVHIKLADFGLASNAPVLKTTCGTPQYLAPEVWSGARYTVAVDLWSLGVVIFQYAYGLPKYDSRYFDSRYSFDPTQWSQKVALAVLERDSDDLIDFLSSSMLKVKHKERKSASDCLQEVELLLRSHFLPQSKEDELGTPTEMMSSSLLMRCIGHQVDPEYRKGAEAEADLSSFATRASQNSELSTQIWKPTSQMINPEPVGERHTVLSELDKTIKKRSLKRLRGNGLAIDEKLDLWQDCRHNQRNSNCLAEVRLGYIQMTFRQSPVTMRIRDSWLNAEQIMYLAGLDIHRREQILEVMGMHTAVEEEVAIELDRKTSWVCYDHGRYLTQALGLQYTLRPLLRYHRRDLTHDEGEVYRSNPLMGYTEVKFGTNLVTIRRLDFRVNGTHILKAAGKNRNAMISIRKNGTPFDIVTGRARYAGTYLSIRDGLSLCDKFCLPALKSILQDVWNKSRTWNGKVVNSKDAPYKHYSTSSTHSTGWRPETEILEYPLENLSPPNNLGAIAQLCQSGGLNQESGLDDQRINRTTKLHDSSFFTEPSFSLGSFLPQIRGSVLSQFCPNLSHHSPSIEHLLAEHTQQETDVLADQSGENIGVLGNST